MIKLKNLIPALIAFAGAVMPGAANAGVIWTLNNVSFGDLGTATGSFEFDASTNTYSNWSITTSGPVTVHDPIFGGDKIFGPTTYNSADSVSVIYPGAGFSLDLQDASSQSELLLRFLTPLTGAGGTVSLALNSPDFGKTGEYDLSGDTLASRLVTGGTVTGAATSAAPEPSTLGLLGCAVACLGVLKRKTAGSAGH